ncbi:MAG: DUF5664 domain-containing protein [Hyphomicrobium sp.]|nr:DUF5664 domain-containing protein [Hyphomicrobium sp.]
MTLPVAVKNDHGKNPLELLPPDAVWITSLVLMVGEAKYDADNWAKGMSWRRMIGALKRHTTELESGVDLDAETGLIQSAHIACCALFLAAYQLRQIGTDDRVKVALPELPEKTKQLIADLRRAKEARIAKSVPELPGQEAPGKAKGRASGGGKVRVRNAGTGGVRRNRNQPKGRVRHAV